jgi:hypothetical protein
MPASTHHEIASAVKTAIETLSGEPTVKVRAQMWLMDEDTLPLIVVTMGVEEEEGAVLGGGTLRTYEIVITILYASNQKIETTIADAKGWRESIRKRLVPDNTVSQPILPGVTAVYAARSTDLPADDERAFGNNYEMARLGMTYSTCEDVHA